MDPERQAAIYGFTTYKNYLSGLSHLIDLLHPSYQSITTSLKEIEVRPGIDVSKIRKLLFNSWNSEALLNLPKFLDEDFIKFSNHWSPVQSYYAQYLATRALIVGRAMDAGGTHETTLNICAHNFTDQKIFPEPWNYICGTGPSYKNLPDDLVESDINSQENPYFFRRERDKLVCNYRQFLKTTRERMVEEKADEWKSRNPTTAGVRTRLPGGKRAEIDSSTRRVSFLDCFYRLRTRSNYKDVDIFILGSNAQDSVSYLNALCNITDKTLFVLESHIARSIGLEDMKNLVQQYKLATNIDFVAKGTAGIAKRIDLMWKLK